MKWWDYSRDSYNIESKIDFVLYDVILTFKGVGVSRYNVPQYFYRQNLESAGLSEIVNISDSLEQKRSCERHAHTCSNPPGMYIKVAMNLFFIIILSEKILTQEFLGHIIR